MAASSQAPAAPPTTATASAFVFFYAPAQHKPKECTRKAKPGDTVHVHYTVRVQPSCVRPRTPTREHYAM